MMLMTLLTDVAIPFKNYNDPVLTTILVLLIAAGVITAVVHAVRNGRAKKKYYESQKNIPAPAEKPEEPEKPAQSDDAD